ncbi:MAG: triose-phosphate isomerase [Bacteriovoracaceae bacterium]|nr:triose-phosphate isomerase [Bacteriovoracaceae bacterium]
MRKKFIVGNWKMNQDLASIDSFFNELSLGSCTCETWVAPQALHISTVIEKSSKAGKSFFVGAQNISENSNGAFTGENSAETLQDLGATFALVGHSERRSLYKEDHALLNKKLMHALSQNLIVVFCVGEQLEERKNGMTEAVIKYQLLEGLKNFPTDQLSQSRLIIAYEPVWAIGTGEVASPAQAQEVHHFIRKTLTKDLDLDGDNTPILYGGSVKPSNADGLLSQMDIDGALVGGASLLGEDFSKLAQIASKLMK